MNSSDRTIKQAVALRSIVPDSGNRRAEGSLKEAFEEGPL